MRENCSKRTLPLLLLKSVFYFCLPAAFLAMSINPSQDEYTVGEQRRRLGYEIFLLPARSKEPDFISTVGSVFHFPNGSIIRINAASFLYHHEPSKAVIQQSLP